MLLKVKTLTMVLIIFITIMIPYGALSSSNYEETIVTEPLPESIATMFDTPYVFIAKYVRLRKIWLWEHTWENIDHFVYPIRALRFEVKDVIRSDRKLEKKIDVAVWDCLRTANYSKNEYYLLFLKRHGHERKFFKFRSECTFFVLKNDMVVYTVNDKIESKIKLRKYFKKKDVFAKIEYYKKFWGIKE